MDIASKNAGEMISRLQMQYNRGRQAAITNELVDIITGKPIYNSEMYWSSDVHACQISGASAL